MEQTGLDGAPQGLVIYTIYKNPIDYPLHWVVRRLVAYPGRVETDAAPTIVCDCLAEARAAIPDCYVRIDRVPGDDPNIVEVWL